MTNKIEKGLRLGLAGIVVGIGLRRGCAPPDVSGVNEGALPTPAPITTEIFPPKETPAFPFMPTLLSTKTPESISTEIDSSAWQDNVLAIGGSDEEIYSLRRQVFLEEVTKSFQEKGVKFDSVEVFLLGIAAPSKMDSDGHPIFFPLMDPSRFVGIAVVEGDKGGETKENKIFYFLENEGGGGIVNREDFNWVKGIRSFGKNSREIIVYNKESQSSFVALIYSGKEELEAYRITVDPLGVVNILQPIIMAGFVEENGGFVVDNWQENLDREELAGLLMGGNQLSGKQEGEVLIECPCPEIFKGETNDDLTAQLNWLTGEIEVFRLISREEGSEPQYVGSYDLASGEWESEEEHEDQHTVQTREEREAISQATIPLSLQEVEAPQDFELVDMDLTKRERHSYVVAPGDTLWSIAETFLGSGERWQEIGYSGEHYEISTGTKLELEVANWLDSELRYGELVKNIPVYNLTHIRNPDELDYSLKTQIYASLLNEPVNDGIREIELFISSSVVDSFRKTGVSLAGWSLRHVGAWNGLLKENGLDNRMAIRRIFIIDDSVADNLNWHFWQGRGEYSLPNDIYNRWVMKSDYRDGAYYNQDLDIDIGWMHENGHYFENLWDLYFADFGPWNGATELKLRDGTVISPEKQTYSLPNKWLMVGSNERPVLSPFSVAAIKHLQEIDISSWGEAYDYWAKEAFLEISRPSYVYFKDKDGNLLHGNVSLFITKPDGVSPDGFTLYRHYEPQPDAIFELSNEGEVLLPSELIGGYSYIYHQSEIDSLSFPDDTIGFGKNFLFVIDTDNGERYQLSLSSYDFLLAAWESESEQLPKLIVTLDKHQ